MCYYMKINRINPTSAAFIMSLGIFVYGPATSFAVFGLRFGVISTICLLIVWLPIYFQLSYAFLFDKTYRHTLLQNPIHSFAVGTWIAGISVLCNVLLKYFPQLQNIIYMMTFINVSIWICFLFLIVYNFIQLYKYQYKDKVHGLILLSVVATQSIVLLINSVLPIKVSYLEPIIVVGIIFYMLSIILLFKRYNFTKKWSLITDWNNTNCVIHGALSITGLALVSTNSLSTNEILAFWTLVFVLLVFVEIIEIIRAIKRIQTLGFKKGIGVYHISQWSRNFTFGMFYAFTRQMLDNSHYTVPTVLYNILVQFITIWAIFTAFLLLYEITLYIVDYSKRRRKLFRKRNITTGFSK